MLLRVRVIAIFLVCVTQADAWLVPSLLPSTSESLRGSGVWDHLSVCRVSRTRNMKLSSCRMIGNPLANAFGLMKKPDTANTEAKAALKRQLIEVAQRMQSKDNREQAEQILEDLVALGQDQKAFETALSGNWRLIWSSQTADANPWQTPASVLGGDCYQVIAEEGEQGPRVENVVVWPALGNLTLRGGASLKRNNATDSTITIDSFTLELGRFALPLLRLTNTVPIAVKDVARVRSGSQLVTVSKSEKAERVLNRREGALKLLYLDREGLRVSQGDNSLLYVHQLVQD